MALAGSQPSVAAGGTAEGSRHTLGAVRSGLVCGPPPRRVTERGSSGRSPQRPFLDVPSGCSRAPTGPVGPLSPADAAAVNGAALSG